MAPGQCTKNKVKLHSKANIKAGSNESYGQPHPSPMSHQIVDSKVTKVQHQPPHPCHQGLRDQEVPGIPTTADGPVRNLDVI